MPAQKKSNLTMRLLTAAVMVPLLLGLIYPAPAWAFYAFVVVALSVGAWELFTMTHGADVVSRSVGVALTVVVSAAFYTSNRDPRALATLLVGVPLFGLLFTLARVGDMATAALRSFAMAAGPLVVGGALTAVPVLKRDLGPGWVVLALVLAWMGDTGGYFAGRFLGSRKLYEVVSPKKTVEGALGGLAASVLGGGVLAHFWYLPSLGLVEGVLLSLVAGALGQAGDLAESLIKRSTGVKDSGAIVPGHGGILDRVDALILTSAAVYLYTLWGQAGPH